MASDMEPMPSETGDDPAALAFDALRQEVVLVRCAVADLVAEHAGSTPPDYNETLGKILRSSEATVASLKGLAEAPALRLDAKGWARELALAGEEARRADHDMLVRARDVLQRATQDVAAHLQSARRAESQHRWVVGAGVVGMVFGMLLWAFGAGAIARAMPESWQWPERMAAQIVGLDPEAAGTRLIAIAAPQRWHDIVLGYGIVTHNRDAIARCEQARAKSTRSVRCVIEIGGVMKQ